MSKQKTRVRAELYEFEKRVIKVEKRYHNLYLNGENNIYPNEYEMVTNASPTALKCQRIKSKFIGGKALKVRGVDVKYRELPSLNNKGHNAYDIIENASQYLAGQRGVYCWVGYGIEGEEIKPNKYEVLDFSMCRIVKEDDMENEGKIYYGDFESRKKVERFFYPFNSNQDVVKAQILRDFEILNEKNKKKDVTFDLDIAIQNYRGQIAFLNLDKSLVYPLHALHGAYLDADTEYRISIHTNKEVREGFLGKTMVITQNLDDDGIKKIKKDIPEWLGAEGGGGVFHFHVMDNVEDITKVLHIQQLKAQFDDKLFEATEKRTKSNIIGAFNIPAPLVDASDGALFGTSGDAYNELKKIMDDLTESDRQALENFFYKLGLEIEIVPITADDSIEATSTAIVKDSSTAEPVTDEAAAKNMEAQAALRGSVGGVQGVLGIQASVSSGTTDMESAITILVEIYGFTREVSEALLGNVKKEVV